MPTLAPREHSSIFLKTSLVEKIHQRDLNSILTNSFDELLQCYALVSPRERTWGHWWRQVLHNPTPPPLLSPNPLTNHLEQGYEWRKTDIVANKDDEYSRLFLLSDIESSSKTSNTDSAIYDQHIKRMVEKRKMALLQKRTGVMHVQVAILFLPSFKCGNRQHLHGFLREPGTFEPEHGRRKCIQMRAGDGLDVTYTLTIRFRRAFDFLTYRLADQSAKYYHMVLKNISKLANHTWPHEWSCIRLILLILSYLLYLCVLSNWRVMPMNIRKVQCSLSVHY